MLTTIILAKPIDESYLEKHIKMLESIGKTEREFEVVFLANSDFPELNFLKLMTSNLPGHYLIVAEKSTTDDEMIQMGIEFASGNDVLLCTADTLPEVVEKVLEKKKDRKIVYVRRKLNGFKTFFQKIGIWAYNVGLKINGKNSDNFAETRIQYFDGKIANNLADKIANNRELRITNAFKQARTGTVENKQIFFDESKKKYKEKNMFGLGFVSFIYILCLLAVAIIYPCLNNGIYDWWIMVLLVLWVIFGVIAIALASRKIYHSRCGIPLRANNFDEPLYSCEEIVKTGDEIVLPVVIDKPVIKNKAQIGRLSKQTKFKKVDEIKTATKKTATTKTKASAKKTTQSKDKKATPKNKTAKK